VTETRKTTPKRTLFSDTGHPPKSSICGASVNIDFQVTEPQLTFFLRLVRLDGRIVEMEPPSLRLAGSGFLPSLDGDPLENGRIHTEAKFSPFPPYTGEGISLLGVFSS
jgi:hypothetical protein